MTIKVGNQYIHTVLGYVDDAGTTVITGDPELATMTGKYSDTSAVESTDPAAYAWEEIDLTEPDEETDEDEEETGESDNDLLFRLAATQSAESVQENLVTGTNQGAEGWQAGAGTLEDAACSPEENGATVNGVRWTAAANDTLSRTADIAGEAVPDSVTVSFWWNASAQCGLTVSIGDNVSEKQCNYDSADLDEDGNALDLSGAWLFFEALVPISTTADSYPVKITADSAATIDLCDFKVEPGDKTTDWTTSSKEAMDTAQNVEKASVNGNGNRTIEIYDSGGSSGLKSYINIANGTIRIAGQSLQIDTDELSTTASIIDSVNTYTTFDSDLISSGSVRVTCLLGKLCLLEGNLTLSGAASSTTVILDDTKVPANAAGTKYINLSNSQNSSFTRPLALRTNASGGLAIHYGAAARYDFSWLYVTS